MAFNYTMPAHETKYAGCLFRSRLEATWAAFFDLCGMPWVYEPFDLPGWSPDFLIGEKLLVEVKPITEIDEDVMWKIGEAAFAAGRTEPIVLFGVSEKHSWHIDVSPIEQQVYCDLWRCDLWKRGGEFNIDLYVHKSLNLSITSNVKDSSFVSCEAMFNEAKNRVRFSYSK